MPIARAVSAKFKAFLFPVIESYSVVPVFRSSVIPRFPVSPGYEAIEQVGKDEWVELFITLTKGRTNVRTLPVSHRVLHRRFFPGYSLDTRGCSAATLSP